MLGHSHYTAFLQGLDNYFPQGGYQERVVRKRPTHEVSVHIRLCQIQNWGHIHIEPDQGHLSGSGAGKMKGAPFWIGSLPYSCISRELGKGSFQSSHPAALLINCQKQGKTTLFHRYRLEIPAQVSQLNWIPYISVK